MQAGGHEFDSRILHLVSRETKVYLENCIQRKSIDDKNILYIKTSEVMLLTTLTIQSEENRLKINWPIANTCNAMHV